MNFTAIKKSSPTWQKFPNDYDMIQLQNQQFTSKTLHERECYIELLMFSKDVLKNFANFTGKHLCRVKYEPKSLIYPYSLHLHYKKGSCFSVGSAEFLRTPFFYSTSGRVLLTLYSTYLNQTTTWRWVFY